MKNTPTTIEASVLDTVAGGWRHHGWHHRGGYSNRTVVNNYWGAQAAPAPTSNVSMQMSAGYSF